MTDQQTIARWQQAVKSRDTEIALWKIAVVALLAVIGAQWWGAR